MSDIHIPNTETEKPYTEMLKQFCAELYALVKRYGQENVRIVLCGDTFHQKIKASQEAKRMFHILLNYLNAIGKVLIFAGNHDMLENNLDRLDSISSTFDIKGVYPNVTYLDKEFDYKSGYMIDDNVIWVLYSMFDKFNRPNIDGLKEMHPDKKIIGLYHGEITGAVNDCGRMFENGIDTNLFKGCDCVMAGHIHKFQELKKGGVPIVYAGSLFQQDSGENLTGHGIVEWDLETMNYSMHEVTNKYRVLKFKISSYEDVENDEERLINL